MRETNRNLKLIFQAASFLIPFIVYLITLAPTVSFIDTGELATVATKLLIAHPTGYPLFTVLGNLFSKIPIGEEIYRLNFMSAFVSSAAIFVLFSLIVFLLKDFKLNDDDKNIKNKKDNSRFQNKNGNLLIYIIALTSSLILAFSSTFWEN